MPRYCFECQCGRTEAVIRPMSESSDPLACQDCGEPMQRDIPAEHGRKTTPHFAKPIELWSIAPNTPEEYRQLAEAGAEMGPQGVPLARSRSEKLRLLNLVGHVEMS